MKTTKGLMSLLLLVLAVFTITGCSHMDKTDVESVITNELDLLKNLDSDTTQKYVSYKELFPDATSETRLSKEVKEVFSLFFQDFDYKILNISVDRDKKEATASITLTTIDARTLAKDYAVAQLKADILKAAESSSSGTEESTDSLEDRYLILNSLLKNNTYETVQNECTLQLHDTGTRNEVWEITRNYTLENALVGGLMTDLADSDLLSPEDTMTVYLDTLKTMDDSQLSNYLGIESLLNSEDSDKNSIAAALVDKMHDTFDFSVTGSEVQGYSASVTTKITTFDSSAILEAYQKELDDYLASADAVIDGREKRLQKSMELLLENIKNSDAAVTTEAVFHFTNDGTSWTLDESGETIGNAIFGTLSSTPQTKNE